MGEDVDLRVTKSAVTTDPTELTIDALRHEIEALRQLLDARMTGVDNVLREKFLTVERQFQLVESQRVEQKKDTKDAVDAALTAQKEAVKEQTIASERAIAKSESSTERQLEQLGTTFKTEVEGLRRQLADLKESVAELNLRVAAPEQRQEGRRETITNGQALMAVVLALIAIAGFVVALVK